LHAYFEYYRGAGVLPPRAVEDQAALTLYGLLGGSWTTPDGSGSQSARLAAERTPIGHDDGLLKEIAGARLKNGAGIWRLDLRKSESAEGPRPVTAVLKVKAVDRLLQELSATMAGVCRQTLGELFDKYRDAFGLARPLERELELHELQHPGLMRHRPACYGTFRDPDGRCWAMLLEYLPEADTRYERPHLRADEAGMHDVLQGLAEIRGIA